MKDATNSAIILIRLMTGAPQVLAPFVGPMRFALAGSLRSLCLCGEGFSPQRHRENVSDWCMLLGSLIAGGGRWSLDAAFSRKRMRGEAP